jgi:hypothetical protein
MREIITHVVPGIASHVSLHAMDEPGQGGAHHHYRIEPITLNSGITPCDIKFQNGPIKEEGVNGINEESLLAIAIHRLESFQKGPFSCRENAIALTKLQEALHWMHHRTIDRTNRKVEGQNKT